MTLSISPLFETKALYETTQDLIGEVAKRQAMGGVDLIGLPSVFDEVNHVLGGYRSDEQYAVGGATGSGKSSFVLSEAIGVAKSGGSVFYLSLEMSAKLLALRTLSILTGLPAMKIEKGQLTDESLQLVRDAAETFKGLPLYFYDRSASSTELATILKDTKNYVGLDMAIVDYIALMSDKGATPYERVSNISMNLRSHARDFNIPMLVVSQLNRASLNRESGRPALQDLKESGQVENDSGAVIFPFRPKNDEENPNPDVERAELIIAKNRHGPIGSIAVEFVPKRMQWRPIGGEIVNPPSARRENRSIA